MPIHKEAWENNVMIDQFKLAVQIEKYASALFVKNNNGVDLAQEAWHALAEDLIFKNKLSQLQHTPWPIPLWEGQIDAAVPITVYPETYSIISVDGSQIYPERHIKSSCFLINLGIVRLEYGKHSSVFFDTIPFVYPLSLHKDELSVPWINGMRHELEFEHGFLHAALLQKDRQESTIKKESWLLFDGSLIFWHLEAQKNLKERFLPVYLMHLMQAHKERIYTAGYISDPKSKELINLIRLYLSDFEVKNEASYESVNHLTDAILVKLYVPEGCRTIIFKSQSPITFLYPPMLMPYFFYINVGSEVARVELPAWMATDNEIVEKLAMYVKDQVIKGGGYPVVLAEAHEQAVIKAADREIFYSYIEAVKRRYGSPSTVEFSQKLMHKRSMRV